MLTLPSYQTGLLARDLGRLVLGMASTLDAFRSYPLARSYAACVDTTAKPVAPAPRSSLKLEAGHVKKNKLLPNLSDARLLAFFHRETDFLSGDCPA